MQAIARKGYNKRRRTEKPTINNRILSFNGQVDIYWQQNTLADWREIILIQSNLAWENRRHFATPPTVSPPNDVWGTSAEIPYWWRVTTQIRIVLLIGRAAWEICFNQSEALPRSGWWRVISMEFLRSLTSFRWETSGGVPKCRLFLRLSQGRWYGQWGGQKKGDILTGCSYNVRAFFSKGQSKLSVIMRFPY